MDSPRARALYERLGYRAYGREPGLWSVQQPAEGASCPVRRVDAHVEVLAQELRGWALDSMRERGRTGKHRRVHLGELISVLLYEDLAEEAERARQVVGDVRLEDGSERKLTCPSAHTTPSAHAAARPDCNGEGRLRASFATTCRARPQ